MKFTAGALPVSAWTAALLLVMPLRSSADSALQASNGKAALSAVAHVNFKIVIPKVLLLQVEAASGRAAGSATVAVLGNSHSVTMIPGHGSVTLSASSGRAIDQATTCAWSANAAAAGEAIPARFVCTAVMP